MNPRITDPIPPVCKTAKLAEDEGDEEEEEEESVDDEPVDDEPVVVDWADSELPVSLALPVSETTLPAALPGAVTHDLAVFPSIVVTSLASPAAVESIEEIEAGIIQVLAPTTEHNEVAKNLALATSSPLHFWATHWPTKPAHCGITQKHPVSQYGQGVLLVLNLTHSFAQSGNKS